MMREDPLLEQYVRSVHLVGERTSRLASGDVGTVTTWSASITPAGVDLLIAQDAGEFGDSPTSYVRATNDQSLSYFVPGRSGTIFDYYARQGFEHDTLGLSPVGAVVGAQRAHAMGLLEVDTDAPAGLVIVRYPRDPDYLEAGEVAVGLRPAERRVEFVELNRDGVSGRIEYSDWLDLGDGGPPVPQRSVQSLLSAGQSLGTQGDQIVRTETVIRSVAPIDGLPAARELPPDAVLTVHATGEIRRVDGEVLRTAEEAAQLVTADTASGAPAVDWTPWVLIAGAVVGVLVLVWAFRRGK